MMGDLSTIVRVLIKGSGIFLDGELQLLKGKLIEMKTTIYVCQNKSCQFPVQDTDSAFKQIFALGL
jgi:uncharacterized protein YyaL (SSP411 family)